MSDLRKALEWWKNLTQVWPPEENGNLETIVAAARRFLALTETGPDYEAAAREWMGDEPPSEYPSGQEGWDALIGACIEQTIKPFVDAALADYLTEEDSR